MDEDVQALPESPGEGTTGADPGVSPVPPPAGALGFPFRGLTIERLVGVCADTSRVFTARDTRTEQLYQLTIFDPRTIDVEVRPKLRERLKLVQELEHTCFVPLASAGQWGDLVYALRPLPQVWPLRTVLSEYVRQGGEFPGRLVAAIGVEINDLLGYLHEARSDAGLPMRAACGALTLDNVGIQTDGQLVYMGVPQPLADDEGLHLQAPDRTDVVAWQAPEELTGAAPSTRTDVYALGLLLASLVCGGNPLQRRTVPASREAVRVGMASDDHLRAIPAVLAAVLRHTLSPDPAHREPDSRHLTMALNRVRMGYGAETVPADILELIVELFGPGASPPAPPSVQGDEAFLALLGGWCAAGGSTEPADTGAPVPEDDPTAERAAVEAAPVTVLPPPALSTPSAAAVQAPAAGGSLLEPEPAIQQASAPVSAEPRRSPRGALLGLGSALFAVVLLVGAVVAYQRGTGVAPDAGAPTQVTAAPSPTAPPPLPVAMPPEPALAELPTAEVPTAEVPTAEVPVDPAATPPPASPVAPPTPVAAAKPATPSPLVVATPAVVPTPGTAVVAAPPPAAPPAPAVVPEAAPPEAAPIQTPPPVVVVPTPAPAVAPAVVAPRAYNRDAGSALPERYEARNIQEIKKVLSAAEEYAVRAGVSSEVARGSTATLGEALLAAYSPGDILVLRPHAIFLAIVAGGEAGQSASTLRASLARAHARGAL